MKRMAMLLTVSMVMAASVAGAEEITVPNGHRHGRILEGSTIGAHLDGTTTEITVWDAVWRGPANESATTSKIWPSTCVRKVDGSMSVVQSRIIYDRTEKREWVILADESTAWVDELEPIACRILFESLSHLQNVELQRRLNCTGTSLR